MCIGVFGQHCYLLSNISANCACILLSSSKNCYIFFFQSFLSAKLSSAIRQMRLKERRKSTSLLSRSLDEAEPAPKRFRVAPGTDEAGVCTMTEEEREAKLRDLSAEWDGNRRPAVLRLMMANLRQTTRRWILTADGLSLTRILALVPCYQEGSCVSKDKEVHSHHKSVYELFQ